MSLRRATIAWRAAAPLGVQRRFASAEYAHMTVKKNNWIEQNEILRENQFYTWQPNKRNIVGTLLTLVAFPAFVHWVIKSELETKDKKVFADRAPKTRL